MNNLPYCLSERFKVSESTRKLLEKLCSKDVESRMSKQEFMLLKFKKDEEDIDLELKCSSKLVLERSKSDLGE